MIAVAAGEIFEKATVAKRKEPAGTEEAGCISANRPYGFRSARNLASSTYSEEGIKHLLRYVGTIKLHSEPIRDVTIHVLVCVPVSSGRLTSLNRVTEERRSPLSTAYP